MAEPTAAPPLTTIGAALDRMAALRGHAPAVLYLGRTITYRELRERATAAARALIALGVKPGERVGVLLGNQPEWVEMCFAAAYVGATFVPLNTWYKKTELAWTIRHCELSVLVSATRFLNQDYASTLAELVPELADGAPDRVSSAAFPSLRTVVMLGDPVPGTLDWPGFLRLASSVTTAEAALRASSVGPTDHAYILYTSGSLAEPKGVLLDHGGVVRNGHAMGARRGVGPDDRVWIGSPLFYALGAANALPIALTHGAAVVLQGSFEAGLAIRAISDAEATVYYGTGNMSRAILDHPDYSRARIGSLKKGNAGTMAEYKRMTLVEMGISGACPAYGLTESYGNATVGLHDDELEVKLHTNGTALPGTELAIVDPQTSAPLSQGRTGLVLLRGFTTPGYFKNPEETRRALRPDGWFDTGDLGSLDPAGRFIFHSRLKEVIKSGGINVSPIEVEQLLVQHPHVKDAHVVGVAHPVRGELIVAFVNTDRPLPEEELRTFVRERAASFKAPHHVLFRTEGQLPRLPTGKVAKHRLAEEARRELGL